ncbi:tripartite tricarboxylate transporter permease [Phaeovulum sp. NW3]|uniref:tripartite tricarboxylate transporter permease n=1 Tax=Phaeovulum sp. NW3 TaxID=2934933 RepID=UPI0020209C43|nr:tripartite tricarboxylate transporter permease [Phaeovulum sp. NW3]MCL7466626.1 tripartite tricarboxylate transporter permease [Phaeovulum sp. NW3]
MDMLANMAAGFAVALSWNTLLYCLIGVTLGTFIGVLPGIGSLAAVSMLLPVVFYLEPTTALVMLAGVFYGAEYGGSTASILLNLPGTASAAVTCLDGHPLARQGRAGVALFVTTIASFFGAAVGILVLTFAAPLLVHLARNFTSAEFFAVILLGLVSAATISSGSALRGLTMVLFGLLLGTVAIDINSGAQRFTFGIPALYDGFSIVVVAMGLFGVSEVMLSIRRPGGIAQQGRIGLRSMIPSRADMHTFPAPATRGALIGSFIGALPGAGQTIAAFLSYGVEKRVSRRPERFGKGAIEGIAAPESANNAASITAFLPTLTLGIPGSATMALILGALMVYGITPGPMLIERNPELFWGLIASFWIGNIMLTVLNIPLINLWVRLLRIPYAYLYPTILVLVCIGVFSVNLNVLDVVLVVGFGLLGYALRLAGFEPAPLLLGFILGPLLEENLRRTLLVSRGDFLAMLERPLSGTILAITALLLVWALAAPLWRALRARGAP